MVIHTMPFKVKVCGLSDIGLVRHNNEDVWMALPEERFFVLADGMGGHQAGEVAAREAAKDIALSVKKAFKRHAKGIEDYSQVPLFFYKAIEHANQVVYKMSRTHEHLRGMGTTLCFIFFHQEGLIFGHVGDSRIYCFRNKKINQLTQDHSLLRELIDLGQLDEQQASGFLYKNIITKAIGTEPNVEPSVNCFEFKKHDRFLLCSDGLSDLLSAEEIRDILNHFSDNEKALKKLVDVAKDRGGHDNITVMLIEVTDI